MFAGVPGLIPGWGQGRSQRGTQGGLEGSVTVKRSHEGDARAR